MMKKSKSIILSMVAMLLICVMLFSSCSTQIEGGSYSYSKCDTEWVDEITGSQKKELAKVSGYDSKKDYEDDMSKKASEPFLKSSFIFEDDGTGEFKIEELKGKFTWEQDGKEIDIVFEDNEISEIFSNTDFKISSGDLVAIVHDLEYDYALTIILIYELQ